METSKKTTILVFDRDPIGLTGTAGALYASDYECLCARTAEAARKALQQDVDLVVLDLGGLPNETLELLKALQSDRSPDSLPAILLCDPSHVSLIEAADLGSMALRLVKPFDPNSLIELARHSTWMPHLISNRRKRGERPAQKGWVSL